MIPVVKAQLRKGRKTLFWHKTKHKGSRFRLQKRAGAIALRVKHRGRSAHTRSASASYRRNLQPYEVFSLFDGDLGFCDVLKHSIPTTTDKPVYLPHRQIPVQLQSEVRKCLDNWLKQGIIRPSKSPYASQVVIVRKKTGEIRLCVDFRKLNAISIRDSFHCLVLRKLSKLFRQLSGFLVSILHKATYKWLWRKKT